MKIEWVVCVAVLDKACAFVFVLDSENLVGRKKNHKYLIEGKSTLENWLRSSKCSFLQTKKGHETYTYFNTTITVFIHSWFSFHPLQQK